MMNRILEFFWNPWSFWKTMKFYTRRIGMIWIKFYDLEIFSNSFLKLSLAAITDENIAISILSDFKHQKNCEN